MVINCTGLRTHWRNWPSPPLFFFIFPPRPCCRFSPPRPSFLMLIQSALHLATSEFYTLSDQSLVGVGRCYTTDMFTCST